MSTKELLKRIEELFTAKLSAKTGWGRKEVLSAYRDSVNNALMEAIQRGPTEERRSERED